MNNKQNKSCSFKSSGFALLITLIVLVVLTSLAAGLSIQLTMAKRRQQYMIEYQRARYGLDSGLKYILAVFPNKNFTVERREGQPDFSDLFWMNDNDYTNYIADWLETATDEQIQEVLSPEAAAKMGEQQMGSLISQLTSMFGGMLGTAEDPNTVETDTMDSETIEEIDMSYNIEPNDIIVPGPYGPEWPYVEEPTELEIGPCKVTISIEDENAKMPLSWLAVNYKEEDKSALYAFNNFCDWMQIERTQRDTLISQLKDITKKKTYKINAAPIIIKTTTTSKTTGSRITTSRRRSSRTQAQPTTTTTKTTTKTRPAVAHLTDFAKLFHSSLLDTETLALPIPEDTGERIETPLKYLALWGSQRVNVNTAPRHVLESAFLFAMSIDDATQLAHDLIQKRQETPIKNIDEIKELGGLDTDTFNALKNYITTTSKFYKIHVTSRSGNASAGAVATVVKEGKNVETLAVMYDR